jgi:hypothetical protein
MAYQSESSNFAGKVEHIVLQYTADEVPVRYRYPCGSQIEGGTMYCEYTICLWNGSLFQDGGSNPVDPIPPLVPKPPFPVLED